LHQEPEEPSALLIVTCRTREQFDVFVTPQGTGGISPREVPEVSISEFSVEEFLTVWQKWFPGEPVPDVGAGDESYATLDETTVRNLKLPLAAALRHPVLLGCLKKGWTPEQRVALVDGNEVQWRRLMELYINWFSSKVVRRHRCEIDSVQTVLRAAAVATEAGGTGATFDMEHHWVVPGRNDSGEPLALVKAVFKDAVTAGLIVSTHRRFEMPSRGPVPWTWHFAFVPEYLRSLP
jgi:hypothetical protein